MLNQLHWSFSPDNQYLSVITNQLDMLILRIEDHSIIYKNKIQDIQEYTLNKWELLWCGNNNIYIKGILDDEINNEPNYIFMISKLSKPILQDVTDVSCNKSSSKVLLRKTNFLMLGSKKVTNIPSNASNIQLNHSGKYISYVKKDQLIIFSVNKKIVEFNSIIPDIIKVKWNKAQDELLVLSNVGEVEKENETYQKVKISKFNLKNGHFVDSNIEDEESITFDVNANQYKIDPSLKWIITSSANPCNRGSQGGSCDGVFYLWDAETGSEIRKFFGHTAAPTEISWDKDGSMFASGVSYNSEGLADNRIILWKPKKYWNLGWYNTEFIAGEYDRLNFPKNIYGLSVYAKWTKDINHILVGISHSNNAISAGETDYIPIIDLNLSNNTWNMKGWDLSQMEPRRLSNDAVSINIKDHLPSQKNPKNNLELYWLNKGQALPFTSKDDQIELLANKSTAISKDLVNIPPNILIVKDENKNDKITIKGHKGFITSAEWSPDGRKVLIASTDGSVRIWEVDTGREVARYEGIESESFGVIRATWSSDGKWIMVTGASTRIWSADVNMLLDRANELMSALPDLGEKRRASKP